MPWAQGVGRSNRPAPTKLFYYHRIFEAAKATAHLSQRCSGPLEALLISEHTHIPIRHFRRRSIYIFDYNFLVFALHDSRVVLGSTGITAAI